MYCQTCPDAQAVVNLSLKKFGLNFILSESYDGKKETKYTESC